MLQNLINRYEDNSQLKLPDFYGAEFVNYIKKLQNDTKKVFYIEQRVDNLQLTQKELSEQIGITPKTICEWQHDSFFNRVIVELIENKYNIQRIEVIDLLFSEAKKLDYKAIELFLKFTSK